MKWIDKVLAIALERPPEPLSDEAYLDGSVLLVKVTILMRRPRAKIGLDPTDLAAFAR